MTKLAMLEVGKEYDFLKGSEGVTINLYDTGFELSICFDNPIESEIQNYKNGKIKYGILFSHNIIFFLFRFGDEDWIDVPFVGSRDALEKISEIKNSADGYSVKLFFSNSRNGKLEVLRLFSLNNETSKSFYKLYLKQQEKDFSKDEYKIVLKNIYNKLSTNEMVKFLIAKGRYN